MSTKPVSKGRVSSRGRSREKTGRRAPRRGETSREGLLDLALEVMAREGRDAATMKRLASEAGLTTPALYRYFPGGREELMVEVIRHQIREFVRNVLVPSLKGGNLDDCLWVEGERKVRFLEGRGSAAMRFSLLQVLEGAADSELRKELGSVVASGERFITGLLGEEARGGRLREDLDLDATIVLWNAIAVGIDVLFALGFTEKVSVDRLYDEYRMAFLDHVMARRPAPRKRLEGRSASVPPVDRQAKTKRAPE